MFRSTHQSTLAGYFSGSVQFFYILLDRKGQYKYCNPFFERTFGEPRLSNNSAGFFADEKKLHSILDRCLQGQVTSVAETFEMYLPGTIRRSVQWEFSPCEMENGDLYVQAIGSTESGALETMRAGLRTGNIPERYRAYEQSTEGIWCFDSTVPIPATAEADEIIRLLRYHAKMTECNQTMAKMYGYQDASEIMGTIPDQLIDYSNDAMIETLREFIGKGLRPMKIETREFDRFGKPMYFLNTMEGMVENGLIKRIWGTQQDITEQRQAEERNRYLALLMENVSDIIISQDKDFNIVSWNNVAEAVYGYTADEMIGRKIAELLHFEYQGITRPEFFRLLEEKGSWKGEAYTVNKSGQPISVLATITKILDESGRHTGYISVSKDITEKRRSEEQLQKSELFYRNLIAESLDGILLTDAQGIITYISASVTKILGYAPSELNGTHVFDYVYPEDLEIAITSFYDEVNLTGKVKFISIRLLDQKKELVWCLVRGHNMLDNAYVGRMVIYFTDDTLRKKAELALMESENRFRRQATVLGNVTDVIVTFDLNWVVTSWNSVCEKLTGITEKESIGKEFRNVLETDFSPFTNGQVADIVLSEGIWRGELSFIGADGERKYLLHTISRLHNEKGEAIGMLGVGKDITERKKIEARLQQSESFYRTLATNSLDGILMTDASGKIHYCGPSIVKVSGYDINQLIGHSIFEFVHKEDKEMAFKAFQNVLHSESGANYTIARLRHASRGWVWCIVRGHNLLEDPVLRSMVIYFTDDTRRKQIEDKLRESESRFRHLIHNLKLGIILVNDQFEVLVSNQAAWQMLGLTEEELVNWRLRDTPSSSVVYEDGSEFPREQHPIQVAIRTRQPVRDVVMGLFRPITNDRVWLLVNAEPVLDAEGNIVNVICSLADITEQRRLSQQLVEQEIQKQKLITQAAIDGQEKERQEIGKELHDNINQHITTTRLYLEVASDKASGEVLEMINLAHKNLAGIVNEIRHLSQSLVPPTLGDLGLSESIQDLCDSLRRAHSFKVEFQHRYFNEEGIAANLKLMIFRIIQEQISNIIRHAQSKTIRIKLETDAENIIFSVSDDGKGFDPQDTKRGMGFSNISNRASLFSGKAEIISAPGKGCTVIVTIPLIQRRELI